MAVRRRGRVSINPMNINFNLVINDGDKCIVFLVVARPIGEFNGCYNELMKCGVK